MLLGLFAPAHAGQERYDYDALGRLVRVIDEQGRVTEYVYDAAGNLLQVIRGAAGSAAPPVIAAFSPASIRRGESKTFQVTGTGLNSAQVATSDPGLDISGLQISATQISFTLTAAATAVLGTRQLSISSAAGSASIQVVVNPVLPRVTMSPQPIAVPPTSVARSFFVSLSSADNIEHTVSLTSSNPAVVTVSPASVVFAPGETDKLVSVTGKSVGNAAINLSSALLAPNSVPVFVTAEFSGITTSFALPLGVTKGEAAGAATPFGPFTAPLVGIAKGAYIEGVSPDRVAIGSGPTNL